MEAPDDEASVTSLACTVQMEQVVEQMARVSICAPDSSSPSAAASQASQLRIASESLQHFAFCTKAAC